MTGKTLKKRRLALNVRAVELAERAGIAKSNLSAMESGKRPIGKDTEKRLKEALAWFKAEQKAMERWWARRGDEIMGAEHLKALRIDHGMSD